MLMLLMAVTDDFNICNFGLRKVHKKYERTLLKLHISVLYSMLCIVLLNFSEMIAFVLQYYCNHCYNYMYRMGQKTGPV